MSTQSRPGRHRSPKRHNPVVEIAGILRDAAPSSKGIMVVAATGGLMGALGQTAHADTALSAQSGATQVLAGTAHAAVAAAPAVVGPATATAAPTSPTALANVGFVAPAARAKPAPVALVDHVHEAEVKAAAAKKAAAATAAKKAAAATAAKQAAEARTAAQTSTRASRNSTRAALTTTSSSNSNDSSDSSDSTPTVTRGAGWGVTSSYNWASAGQCTWGALNKWYQATGTYLGGFYGNAGTWGYKAANAGWTVSGTPRARSIVVMAPGVHGSSRVGHVGWVTSVSGNSVTIVEMNALAGPYRYNTRTLSDTGGMQYIYAP